ncbi:MAG: DEAD/DEAH box helicase [Euryarchaeota archaeon]|nr:DEAD/DEAH box helicase [Euryarchaeota archaeon]
MDKPLDSEELYESLCQPVRNWFREKFPDFTEPQKLAIPAIQNGDHLLLCSPTGSGKTLTAFLTIIDKLVRHALAGTLENRVYCLYISPIKALANDIQKNLIGPLAEIEDKYLPDRAQGKIRVGLRTGDTPQSERQKMLRKPPHILITTPESMAIAISSPRFQPIVSNVEWIIIDEMHSLVPTKRGVHLALTISLLDTILERPVQRLGISATMEPLETVAEYLVSSDDRESRNGAQEVKIAKISGARELDLDILLCSPKFSDLSVMKVLEQNVEMIADLISAHTTTLVFANTRKMTETLVQKLRPYLGELVAGHHGSMDKSMRLDVERKLKLGHLRAVVTSSSLEMGIDIGSVDMVIQVGSPGDIATALQRIGRAGHHVGGIPRARFLPSSVDDLIELAALQAAIQTGEMDLLDFPQNCLDVVAQFLIGLVIINERDIDEAFEIVTSTWSYRNLEYDDFIEVLDMLQEERRVWIDWEENLYGKRGYSRMIYYTNIGTIAPDNSYLVFNAEGSILGQLSSSFVANLRGGDVILLGGSTYRVTNIQGTRVNVASVTGYRPTVPSWSGEARSRSRELSAALLDLIGHTVTALRRNLDPRAILRDAYGLGEAVSNTIARHLEEHTLDSFQVPDKNRLIVEQIVSGGMPTYLITSCRGRGFNTALGYFMAGLAEQDGIAVLELSFDENGLLIKTSQEVDPGDMYELFQSNNHLEVIERYIVNTQIFAKRFREVAGRSMIIPKRIGAEEVSPQQFQQRADALLQRHRSIEDSLLIKEAKAEIMFGDIDIKSLNEFLEATKDSTARIVHTKVPVPSRLGMSLYMSTFEDLLSMKTRAFLVKDIDPEILRRLLGNRSLATELTDEQLKDYYSNKVPNPTNSSQLLHLMSKGGGLDRNWENPLYKAKLAGIDHGSIESWVEELAASGEITKLRGTGMKELDDKWFSSYMAEIHGTLGCIAIAGGKEVEDVRDLYTKGVTYEIAVGYDGLKPTKWEKKSISDPHEALRVKIIEMLGSEGPSTGEEISGRLPFPQGQIDSILHELEIRNVISVGFFTQTDDAEFILKVDEHRITGGEEDVVEYRWVQNLVMKKSFETYPDGFTAFDQHILFQKQQEMMYRVDNFSYADWKDLQLDSDVLMGRLLHNRIGYTTQKNLPMLLGLKPEPWLGEMEKLVLEKVPKGENLTRQEILADFPKGDDYKSLQRDLKNAISNLERQLCLVKQFEDVVGRRRRLSLFHRVHEVYEPMSFEDALVEVIQRMGPVKAFTLRYYVSRSVEELTIALRNLETDGRVARVMALVPEPEAFYVIPDEVAILHTPNREDRTLRILTQSDPYVSRFIWEVRSALDRGWYLPVFKGVDPIGKVLMFKVNDYLEIKDMHIPYSYLDEFCAAFEKLLENHADQLIDVAVLSQFNGIPVKELDADSRNALEQIGFKLAGERMIRGGVVDPQPREIAERALFNRHHLHQNSRLENEIEALESVQEVRDDFGLRGRAEVYRVGLKNMASAHQLHQGINLRGHQVWASYDHFSTLLAIRGQEPHEELIDILEFFESHSDPNLFMERHAMKRAAFRKLIQPLLRSGHMVQDYRGGFRSVSPRKGLDRIILRREYLRRLVSDYPVITLKQFIRLAGTPFQPEELKAILTEFEDDSTLIKGFLIQDLHEVCWGRKDLLEEAKNVPPIRDFVIPPSDPIAPYFADVLKQKFGFGSAYLVFHNAEPVAAFKANTRDKVIDVTDYEGSEKGWRIVKEFAWEHQMPLKTDLRIGGKKRK